MVKHKLASSMTDPSAGNPSLSSSSRNYLDTSKFSFSKPLSDLRAIPERTPCPKCQASRRYYCYECIVPIAHTPPVPSTPLPVQFHIIRHVSERISKSSTVPLKLTYPNDVHLYEFKPPNRFDPFEKHGTVTPSFPEDFDWTCTAILFPGVGSKTIQEVVGSEPSSASTKIKNVIVIESTWSTAKQVMERLPCLSQVKLMIKLGSENQTIFWRHQTVGRNCLATCEAIYVFLRELHDSSRREDEYAGEFDDVLYYYIHVHSLVLDNYKDAKKHRGNLPRYTLTPPLDNTNADKADDS